MGDQARSFWPDKLGQAQRRRLEALRAVATLWPHIDEQRCLTVAKWIVRGEAKIKVEETE